MNKNKIQGFTLVELMVVLIIISIFAAISVPSYNRYILRKDLGVAKKEAMRFANELEKFKSKNFSYKGFNPRFTYSDYDQEKGELLLPVGSDATSAKYILSLVDLESKSPLTLQMDDQGKETDASEKVSGLSWAMKVVRAPDSEGTGFKQPENYDLLMTSTGVKCKTLTAKAVDGFESCGDNKEDW